MRNYDDLFHLNDSQYKGNHTNSFVHGQPLALRKKFRIYLMNFDYHQLKKRIFLKNHSFCVSYFIFVVLLYVE